MKMKLFSIIALALLTSVSGWAQTASSAIFAPLPSVTQLPSFTAPANPPGYSVSIFAGYTSLANVQNANGFYSSITIPVHTWGATNWTTTVAARLDNFITTNPSVNEINVGPEARFQFSKATFLDGQVFQPFVNAGVGAARSSCVAAGTCAAGQNSTSHIAYKTGGGLDMVTSTHVTWRLFEVDYIHSTVYPGNHVTISNFAQALTGIAFTF